MLTLVIPTKNRYFFLSRLLKYFFDRDCRYQILIGDSSDDAEVDKTKALLDKLNSKLNVLHLIDPKRSCSKKAGGWQTDNFLHNLVGFVKTPYVAFLADDDFLVVDNLEQGVLFLNDHPEYSFVCGDALVFNTEENVPFGNIISVKTYPQRSLELSSRSERLSSLFSRYTVFEYGISRTEEKKYRWEKVFGAQVDNLTGELINCSLVVLQGKVKKLDKLMLVRQAHPAQTSNSSEDIFDYVERVTFRGGYERLRDILAQELIKVSDVCETAAREHVKKCFWSYLANLLSQDWTIKYQSLQQQNIQTKIKKRVKELKYLSEICRSVYSYLPIKGKNQLPLLLRKRHVWHDDFLPIYNLVNGYQTTSKHLL